MIDTCLDCDKFRSRSIRKGVPVPAVVYSQIPRVRRIRICSGEDKAVIFYCGDDPEKSYVCPSTCRFHENCMSCRYFTLGTFNSEFPMPVWLLETLGVHDEIRVLYCSRRKRGAYVYIIPLTCPSFISMSDDDE